MVEPGAAAEIADPHLAAGAGPAGHRDVVMFRALAAIAFIVLFYLARTMTFRTDDWDLIANVSLSDPISLFRPHNEQWLTIPALLFRAVFLVVGMHTYLPYIVGLLLVHIATAAGMGRLVGALSGPLPGLLASVVVLFLGSACEVLGQAIGLGVVLGTGAGLWALDALIVRRRHRRAAVLLLVSLMSHPVGVVFLGMAFVIALARDRDAIAYLFVPTAIFLTWFVLFDVPVLAERSETLSRNLAEIPPFIAGGIAAAAGAAFGFGPVVGIALAAVLAYLVFRVGRRPEHPVVFAAAVLGLVGLYGLIAVSRGQFGVLSLLWSRYFYLSVPLVLLAVAGWFGHPASLVPDRRSRLAPVLIGLTTVAVVGNLRYYVLARDQLMEPTHQTRAAVAIASWATDLHDWHQELFMPGIDEVRALVAAHGDLTRDAWLPVVVPPVPPPIAADMCRQLVPGDERQAACVEAVARGVGG